MRVQLNREKLEHLHEFVVWLLNEYPAGDKAEELVDALINKIRIKLRNRMDSYNAKNNYCTTLTKEEALALFIWMQQLTPMIPKNFYAFEQNITLQITNQIDQTYGTIGARKITGAIATAN